MFRFLKNRRWLIRKLCKAWGLSWAEWFLLVRASGLFLAVALGLKLLPFETLLARLGGRGRVKGERPGGHPISVERVAYIVELASRYHMLKPTCLKKAIVLYRILRTRGVAVELVVGVTKAEGQLKAHAWVDHRGQVISGGAAVDRYLPVGWFGGGEATGKRLARQRQTP